MQNVNTLISLLSNVFARTGIGLNELTKQFKYFVFLACVSKYYARYMYAHV